MFAGFYIINALMCRASRCVFLLLLFGEFHRKGQYSEVMRCEVRVSTGTGCWLWLLVRAVMKQRQGSKPDLAAFCPGLSKTVWQGLYKSTIHQEASLIAEYLDNWIDCYDQTITRAWSCLTLPTPCLYTRFPIFWLVTCKNDILTVGLQLISKC